MHISEYKNMFEREQTYWWYVGLHTLVYDMLCHQKISKNASILDAGCGTGGLIDFLNQKSYKNLNGFDFSEDAINFCHQRGYKNCFRQDLNTWKPEKKYDVIISCDVLYHKNIINDKKIISKFKEALNPGGILILNLPAFELLKREHDIVVETKKRYTIKTLKEITKNLELKPILINYRLPLLFVVILFSKLLTFFLKKRGQSDLDSISNFTNNTLLKMNLIENKIICKKIAIPFGSSIFSVLKN